MHYCTIYYLKIFYVYSFSFLHFISALACFLVLNPLFYCKFNVALLLAL